MEKEIFPKGLFWKKALIYKTLILSTDSYLFFSLSSSTDSGTLQTLTLASISCINHRVERSKSRVAVVINKGSSRSPFYLIVFVQYLLNNLLVFLYFRFFQFDLFTIIVLISVRTPWRILDGFVYVFRSLLIFCPNSLDLVF